MNEQKPNNYFLIQRDWRKSEIFELFDEPFDKGSAWIYLIENAAWKARRFLVGSVVHILERGQLTASLRFLAKAWKWSKNKVDAFLKALQAMDMVKVDKRTGQNLITICNYGKYQIDVDVDGTAKGQQKDSQGTAKGQLRDKTKKVNKVKKVNNVLVEENFNEFWEKYKSPHEDQMKHKGGKKPSLTEYKKALKVSKHDTIMLGLSVYLKELDKDKYVGYCGAARWLRDEGWLRFEVKPVTKVDTNAYVAVMKELSIQGKPKDIDHG